MAKMRQPGDVWGEDSFDIDYGFGDPQVPQGAPQAAPPTAPQAPQADPLADLNKQYGFEVDDDWARGFSEGRLSLDDLTSHMNRRNAKGPDTNTPGGGGGQASGQSGQPDMRGDIFNSLKGLFPGGMFNQDLVNRRTSNVRDDLERFRKSTQATNQAALASRGLIGDGPEQTAMNRSNERIGDLYQNAASGIYADESERADQRMMQALGLASNMSEGDANRAIDWFRANTDRTLGTGSLGIGNMRAVNDYNLGLGRLGLDRDRLGAEIESGNIDQLIALIQQLYGGANTSAGGYY